MGQLIDLGIVKGADGKAAQIFEDLFPDIFALPYQKPSDYILNNWEIYQEQSPGNNPNINGKIFEYLLATLLIREEILPLYLSAQVAFVPNVTYDLLLYSREYGPICLSAKTSLRERYKQADLEAIALKYVHRKSRTYLITLSKQEAASVHEKIRNGDVIGIDNVVVPGDKGFDDLIETLREKKDGLIEAPTVQVIQSNMVVTRLKVQKIKGFSHE